MQDLAHSIDALHNVFTENKEVWHPSLVEQWTSLYEKYSMNSRIQGVTNGITTPGDVKLFIDFLKDLQTDWDRWSVVFGGLGTAMVALSAVLSGSAVLSSDYGVKCDKARSEGAVDTSSFLSSQVQAVDHNICIKRRKSRAKAKPLQVEAEAIAAPGEASPHPGECPPIEYPYKEDYSKFDVQKALKSLEDLVQAVAVKPAPKGLPKQVREMYDSFKNAVVSTDESELRATAGAMSDFVEYVYGALLEFELLDKE